MSRLRHSTLATGAAALFLSAPLLRAQDHAAPSAAVMGALRDVWSFLSPAEAAEARSAGFTVRVSQAAGGLKALDGAEFRLLLQPPRHAVVRAKVAGRELALGTDGKELWIHAPEKHLLVIGDNAVPRFSGRPDSALTVALPPLTPPVPAAMLALLPALVKMEAAAGPNGSNYTLSPMPAAAGAPIRLPQGTLTASVPAGTCWPSSLTWREGGNTLTLTVGDVAVGGARPEADWQPKPAADDHTERVALSHLTNAIRTLSGAIGAKIPTLPPATGEKQLVATAGAGRLELHDGTRVLFLSGTPEEMGTQHGTLLKKEIRRTTDRILYGVGVGSSFEKGRWFFGEIEEAVRRTGPFVDPRHLREMDALAAASGMDREEARLSNFFPELFHCSGFAIMGDATKDGVLYHGRVLDYLRGAGLEENAVVMVVRPDQGNAWVNIGYAGFLGSVTAMNEKHISIGEMGGRGEGAWDGKPMAQLMREVMEKASTLDEAVELMRRTPRTCEYYYVIADANSGKAVGVKATPEIFELVQPGEAHPQLPEPVRDAVLLSAGDRYKTLTSRVKAGYGKFDAPAAIDLMSRPVCMTSNIHSVLFAPGSLDFWVANADSDHVASETRFTKYNLRALLDSAPAATAGQ